MNTTNRKSAADIVIRKKAPTDPTAELFERLRGLIASCGFNKHDQATVAITACIEEGIDTAPRIMGALRQLGFNAQHAGMDAEQRHGRQRRAP